METCGLGQIAIFILKHLIKLILIFWVDGNKYCSKRTRFCCLRRDRTPNFQPTSSYLLVETLLVSLGIRLSHIYSDHHFLSAITPQGNRFLVDENSFCCSCFNKFGNWRSGHSLTTSSGGLNVSKIYIRLPFSCRFSGGWILRNFIVNLTTKGRP